MEGQNQHLVDTMKDKYGLDASQPNVEVVTKVDMDKCVDIIDTAITGLSKNGGTSQEPPVVLRDDYQVSQSHQPISLSINIEIDPSRLDEFKKVIKIDAEGSRKEPGCLRFDVLQDPSNPCRFLI